MNKEYISASQHLECCLLSHLCYWSLVWDDLIVPAWAMLLMMMVHLLSYIILLLMIHTYVRVLIWHTYLKGTARRHTLGNTGHSGSGRLH